LLPYDAVQIDEAGCVSNPTTGLNYNNNPLMSQSNPIARKSLGQNFLRSEFAIRRIIEALELLPGDAVLEIGCGTGALTRLLIHQASQYIGVEVDPRLFSNLQNQWRGQPAVFLNQDILKLDFDRLRDNWLAPSSKWKVVGNLPYNISSPILDRLGSYSGSIDRAVIMLQAEVADRLRASAGSKEYGVLTLMVHLYFKVEELFFVPPTAFFPKPKVNSKVLRLTPYPSPLISAADRPAFISLIKQAFSQRRKTLINCLKGSSGIELSLLTAWLLSQGFPLDIRAERLTLEDFLLLVHAAKKGCVG
jgi:16S rRNA (adenine1518-N6/adenine1519-N6)-dimethyltransferase